MKLTITKKLAQRIINEMEDPILGYKGGAKSMVKEIKQYTSKTTGMKRYGILLKSGIEIKTKKEWNSLHKDNIGNASARSFVKRLKQLTK